MVKKGEAMLRLSNPWLKIGITLSEPEVAHQANELRYTRISMEQERLSLQAGPHRYAERLSHKGTSLRAIQAADGGAIDSEGGLSPGYGGV